MPGYMHKAYTNVETLAFPSIDLVASSLRVARFHRRDQVNLFFQQKYHGYAKHQ